MFSFHRVCLFLYLCLNSFKFLLRFFFNLLIFSFLNLLFKVVFIHEPILKFKNFFLKESVNSESVGFFYVSSFEFHFDVVQQSSFWVYLLLNFLDMAFRSCFPLILDCFLGSFNPVLHVTFKSIFNGSNLFIELLDVNIKNINLVVVFVLLVLNLVNF